MKSAFLTFGRPLYGLLQERGRSTVKARELHDTDGAPLNGLN